MKKLATLFAVFALATSAGATKYDTEHGLGLGLIEYYSNNCKEMSSKGKKIAKATDKMLNIKSRHYGDYKDGYEVAEMLGCAELRNTWKEDDELYKWTQVFFNGL